MLGDYSFQMRGYGLDDEVNGLKRTRNIIVDNDIEPIFSRTPERFFSKIKKSTDYDIIFLDNNIRNFDFLVLKDGKKLKTHEGTDAGLFILTRYIPDHNIRAGLRILITNFKLNVKKRAIIDQWKTDGINAHYFLKYDDNHMNDMCREISKFRFDRLSAFMKEKIDYIFELMDEWDFSEREKAALFGVNEVSHDWKLIRDRNATGQSVEKTCDLVYDMKLRFQFLFGTCGEDIETEARWLRANNDLLNGKSPVEFLRTRTGNQLETLLSVLRGK